MENIMAKWEYKFETLKGNTYINLDKDKDKEPYSPINELGEEGWELISIAPTKDEDLYFGYFKREKVKDSYEVKHGARLGLDTNIKIDPKNYLK